MIDTKMFWTLVLAISVAIEIADRVINAMIERRRKREYDFMVEQRCQQLANTIGIDREHFYVNEYNQIDITPEGQEQHDRNMGFRIASEEEDDHGGTITRYERLNA